MSDLGRINPLNPSWPVRPTRQSGPRVTPRQVRKDPRREPRKENPEEDGDTPHIDERA